MCSAGVGSGAVGETLNERLGELLVRENLLSEEIEVPHVPVEIGLADCDPREQVAQPSVIPLEPS